MALNPISLKPPAKTPPASTSWLQEGEAAIPDPTVNGMFSYPPPVLGYTFYSNPDVTASFTLERDFRRLDRLEIGFYL